MLRLFDTAIGTGLNTALTLLRSEEGDALQLHAVPAGVDGGLVSATRSPWWHSLWPTGAAAKSPLERLRENTDAVLVLTRAGAVEPGWLAALDRPRLDLVETPDAEPPRLSTSPHARADGWLAEGRLLNALDAALPADPRLPRLRQAWVAQQRARAWTPARRCWQTAWGASPPATRRWPTKAFWRAVPKPTAPARRSLRRWTPSCA